MKTTIDHYNRLLTNMLTYSDFLMKLECTKHDKSTANVVDDIISIKKKESNLILKEITRLGGDVDTTENLTDEATLSWMPRTKPLQATDADLLLFLMRTEENALKDYNQLIGTYKDDMQFSKELVNLKKQSEKILDFLKRSLDT